MPGLDAPGTSVRPLRLRVLRRVCRALTVSSSLPAPTSPPTLHHPSPFRRPALTCEDSCHSAFIRGFVPEPEEPFSLARTSFRPAPDAPVGLSAQLFRPTAVTALAVTTADRKSSSGGLNARFSFILFSDVLSRAKGVPLYKNLQQGAADGFRRRCYLAPEFRFLYCVHAPSLL